MCRKGDVFVNVVGGSMDNEVHATFDANAELTVREEMTGEEGAVLCH